MNNIVGKHEDMELVDTIILNGIIEMCDTHDDNCGTIGVNTYEFIKRLNGTEIKNLTSSFPFTQEMADRCQWKDRYASIYMLTGNTPIDIDNVEETKIMSMMGWVDSEYCHAYSDLTGYLWTDEEFKCGGHDIPAILKSHLGEYIHMEIELYKSKSNRK